MHQKKYLIVDSGFIVALFNEKDSNHKAAFETDQELGESYQFVSTVFVIQEICWLLLKSVGHDSVIKFMEWVQEEIELPPLPNQWISKVTPILRKYSDRKLDLADASIVVLADHMNLGDVITIDRKDFSVLRWGGGKKHFNNLMLDI